VADSSASRHLSHMGSFAGGGQLHEPAALPPEKEPPVRTD
jgi:hypothetical protein